MAVAVPVVPALLVRVARAARRQPLEERVQVLDEAGLVLDRGERAGGAHAEHRGGAVAGAGRREPVGESLGDVDDLHLGTRAHGDGDGVDLHPGRVLWGLRRRERADATPAVG